MKVRIHSALLVLASASFLATGGCGSDSTAPAEEGPYLHIYAGTGEAGYGDMGLLPRKTELYSPQDVVFGPDDSPFIIDWNNHRVIQVNPVDGLCRIIVGVADGDFGDPCPSAPADCVDILATNAKLNHPTDIGFDANGDLILCAWHNSELFKLNMQTGLMDRFCGDGSRSYNGDDQTAITAFVDLPVSVAFDPQGRIVFCDQANMIIRRIDNGIIETIAGMPPVIDPSDPDGKKLIYQVGFSGNGGPATQAKLSFDRGQIANPSGRIAYDKNGNLYIADTGNHCIRVVDNTGIIHQFAGQGGKAGYAGDGGPAKSALLRKPRDVAIDGKGNVFIADTDNHVIRRVTPDGIIKTIAGTQRPTNATPLSPSQVIAEDGVSALKAHLTHPYGVAIAPDGRLWITDTENHVIRILDKN